MEPGCPSDDPWRVTAGAPCGFIALSACHGANWPEVSMLAQMLLPKKATSRWAHRDRHPLKSGLRYAESGCFVREGT
jgi:hypothetical protein